MGLMLGRMVTIGVLVVASLAGETALAGSHPEAVRVPGVDHATHTAGAQVTVVRGDHLWKISRRHLESHLDRTAGNNEISPYWKRVVEENQDRLRSGDPDLIYPGEVIDLPPVSEQP